MMAGNLGERKIIELIWKSLDEAPRLAVPFGDDVTAFDKGDGNLVVLKADMLVGKTDVPPQMSYWQAARKAVVMNISDLAAKGVKPLGLLASLGIPSNLRKKQIEQIGKGLNAGARENETYILGGDTNETEDLIIDIAAFGLIKKKDLILRSGASPGDIVATTGQFGLSPLGLRILTQKLAAPPAIKKKLIEAVLMPHARLKEGLALAKTGTITASIDSSDGLAWSLYEINHASNVGFVIDALPISPEVYKIAKLNHLSASELCLYGGEEYELVVTIKPEHWKKTEKAIKRERGILRKIGRATTENALVYKQNGEEVKIEARGYEHFKT
jgi:thiamine-monophosphate kinase